MIVDTFGIADLIPKLRRVGRWKVEVCIWREGAGGGGGVGGRDGSHSN